MDMKEAMDIALNFERKGKDIYSGVAAKTANPFVRKTFEYLAEQEDKHIEEIENYFKNQKLTPGGDDAKHVKRFFTTTTDEFKEKLELSEDDMQAHEKGLELENKSYEFYKKGAEEAEKPEVKAFFEFLMQQEMAHYDLIKKSYEYIKDPSGFNAGEEGWFFEG